MHFPPDTVEALEPAMYNRVTARSARMEIDFWKQVMMPLKSGLVSEVRYLKPKLYFKNDHFSRLRR